MKFYLIMIEEGNNITVAHTRNMFACVCVYVCGLPGCSCGSLPSRAIFNSSFDGLSKEKVREKVLCDCVCMCVCVTEIRMMNCVV